MVKQNIFLSVLIGIFMSFCFTGCSTESTSKNYIINTDELAVMMHKDEQPPAQRGFQMVRLKNGVVVYRDRSVSRNARTSNGFDFVPNSDIKFGPGDPRVGPNSPN